MTEALLQREREDDLQLCAQPSAAFLEATRSGALISHPVSTCRMEAVSQAWQAENTGTQLPLPLLTNRVKFPRWKMRDKKTGAAILIPLTEQGSHSTERGLTSLSPHLEHCYSTGLLGTGVEGVGKKSTRTESSVHPTKWANFSWNRAWRSSRLRALLKSVETLVVSNSEEAGISFVTTGLLEF